MSIQPNRVIERIVLQVDQCDWPELPSRVLSTPDGSQWVRIFENPAQERYATPLHFWVHALREDLSARGRRCDLVGAASQALCQNFTVEQWREEIGAAFPGIEAPDREAQLFRMSAGVCRPSSVAASSERLLAHFVGHGPGPSWRGEVA